MATFRDLPSGRTQAVIRLNGKSQSKTFPSREQAEAWADKIEVKERATQIRLSVVMDTYLSMFMKNRGGYDRFEHIHKVILKAMGNKEIRKLTPEDICKFRDRRVAKVAGSTARLECQQLSRLLKHARIHHKIDTSELMRDFVYPRATPLKTQTLNAIQIQQIAGYMRPKMRALVLLGYETAMRRMELCSITKQMVNFQQRVIHLVYTKNGCSRMVPLSLKAIEILRDSFECYGDAPWKYDPHSVSTAWRRAAAQAKISGFTFHDVRHAAITKYAVKGLNTPQLQAVSGHKDVRMLARYTHIQAGA
ncbi:MAG: site-specific integrase [Aeromonadaceae bacterium]|nr:site-specific integrase [Aeromonadaceae bacterium]